MSNDGQAQQQQLGIGSQANATSAITQRAPRGAATSAGNTLNGERNKASNRKSTLPQVRGAEGFLGGSAPGWITFHPEVARALLRYLPTDTKGRIRDRDLANLATLFLAACLRWRGRSTREGGGWFSKTDRQWCEELCVHKPRLYDIVRFVCIDDQTGTALGLPSVGLVRRRTGTGLQQGARYLIDDQRLAAWWLSAGLQPALAIDEPAGADELVAPTAPTAPAALPEAVELSTGDINSSVDNPGNDEGECKHVFTPKCKHVFTQPYKRLFDDEKLNDKEKLRDPKFVLEVLKSAYGDKWRKTLNRFAPETVGDLDRQAATAFLRNHMANALSGEVEAYHRELWGIQNPDVLFELGLGCALLDLDKRTLEERVGNVVLRENGGLTQRNPTGIYINRLRSYMANIAKLEIRSAADGSQDG